MALPLKLSVPWETYNAGWLLSVPEEAPPQVSDMGCEPTLKVPPEAGTMVAAVVPTAVPVPLPFKLALEPRV